MFHFFKPQALVVLLAAASAVAPAWSALTIERNVTITNDAGGRLVIIGSGERDEFGADSQTTATFTQFATGARVIDGKIVRSRTWWAEQVETVYDGALEFFRPASDARPERLDTLVFEALTVTRDGEGPELSGTVIFNGTRLDAADLPKPVARMLARVLRWFAYG